MTRSSTDRGPVIIVAATAIVFDACAGQRLSHPNSPFTSTHLHAYVAHEFSELRLKERLTAYTNEVDAAERQRLRNDFVYGIMLLIDIQYEHATDLMHGTQTWGGAISDVAAISLDAAATLSTGFATRLLAGLSGVTTAGWGTFDKNVFADLSASAIVTQMDALRTNQRQRIDIALKTSDADYPLWRALSDVADYFMAGSPVKALEAISSRAEQELRSAQGPHTGSTRRR